MFVAIKAYSGTWELRLLDTAAAERCWSSLVGRMKNTFSKKIAGKYVRSKVTGEKPAAVLVYAAAA